MEAKLECKAIDEHRRTTSKDGRKKTTYIWKTRFIDPYDEDAPDVVITTPNEPDFVVGQRYEISVSHVNEAIDDDDNEVKE